MIHINLPFFIALLVSFPILLVFLSVLFYTSNNDRDIASEMSVLQQCPYCAYAFRSQDEAQIIVCPQCRSLFDSSLDENTTKKG